MSPRNTGAVCIWANRELSMWILFLQSKHREALELLQLDDWVTHACRCDNMNWVTSKVYDLWWIRKMNMSLRLQEWHLLMLTMRNNTVHVKMEGSLAELLVKINPNLYRKYLSNKMGDKFCIWDWKGHFMAPSRQPCCFREHSLQNLLIWILRSTLMTDVLLTRNIVLYCGMFMT